MSPKFVAQILIEMPKELKSRFDIDYQFTFKEFENVLELTNKHNLQKEAVLDMIEKTAKKQKINPNDYKQIQFTEIEREIKLIIEKDPTLSPNAIMGLIMKKYSGKINPKEVFDIIKKMQ